MSDKKPVTHSVNTAEGLSLGTVFKCGDPVCLGSSINGKGNDIHFSSQKELDKHIFENHKKTLVQTSGGLCKYCKQPVNFSKKFKKIKDKEVFQDQRTTAIAASNKDWLHPECRAKYKETL